MTAREYTRGQVVGTVECQDCGQRHVAEYHHEGRFNEGPVFAVVCGPYIEMYTSEVVNFDDVPANPTAADLGIELTGESQ